MTQDPANIDPGAEQEPPLEPLDEQLSAYLDGELAPDESRQVDLMLAGDAAVRKRLREIQRTWDALDELERTPVNERFTQSTLEIVTSAAVGEMEATAATMPRLRRRRWLARTAMLTAAVGLGFLAVLLLRHDPDRQLLADLPVVERLDQFRYVDDLKFLKQLAVEKLFDEDRTSPDDVSEPPQQVVGRVDESIKDRRQRIEQLAAPQKEELRRRWETYQSLDKAEQQRLHKLQEQLDADPDAAHLRASLDQYHKWLVTLPTFRRAELAELPADERVSRIKSMLDEQASQQARRLPPQDLAVVMRWLEQYSARNDEEPLLRILPESFRHRLGQMNPSERKRVLVSTMILAGNPAETRIQNAGRPVADHRRRNAPGHPATDRLRRRKVALEHGRRQRTGQVLRVGHDGRTTRAALQPVGRPMGSGASPHVPHADQERRVERTLARAARRFQTGRNAPVRRPLPGTQKKQPAARQPSTRAEQPVAG